MAFHVAFRFVQQASKMGSWTENFWCDTNDFSVCSAQAAALREKLRLAKGDQAYCPSYRISQVGVFRAAEQILVPGAKPRSTTTYPSDYPTTKLLLQMKSANGRTQQWFGGVTDSWITKGGFYVPTQNSVEDMNAVKLELVGGGKLWSLRILDPARPSFIIKAINPATGQVTTNQNTLANNSSVRIKGVRGLTQANGVWTITVINNTTFTLDGWEPTETIMTKGNPTVRPQSYIFQKITDMKVVRATAHKVGKNPDQLTGKATTKR